MKLIASVVQSDSIILNEKFLALPYDIFINFVQLDFRNEEIMTVE